MGEKKFSAEEMDEMVNHMKESLTAEEKMALLGKLGAKEYDSKTNSEYDFGFGTGGALRERNAKKLKNWILNNPETKAFREKFRKMVARGTGGKGFDPILDKEKFPAYKEGFSWNKLRDQLDSLKEADSGTMYPVMLAAGVLQNIIGMYQNAKPSYMDWVTVYPTKLYSTPYAPLHGAAFPREVGEQMPYPVSQTAAMSGQLKSRKYGTMLELTQELLDDDQTGQFQHLTGTLGEYLALLTDVLCYGRLASVGGMNYAGYTPGISETQPSGETNWPWTVATSPFIGGGYNKPASFGTPTVANLQNGYIALNQQKNLLGILLPVNTNRIICGPAHMFDVSIILNSAYYPAVGGTAGTTGTTFAVNPLKGISDLTIAKFLFDNTGKSANQSTAWYIVDDSKPWFQLFMREPVSVVQETPTSGESFSRDVVRFKASTRMIADHIDPRFAWQGSDGSV